jgi:hypothetical protein
MAEAARARVLDVLAKISQREKAGASIAALATAFSASTRWHISLCRRAGRSRLKDDFIRYSYAGRRK